MSWKIILWWTTGGGPWAEKYIEAEEQGGANFRILYFTAKHGVAHELKNISKLSNRVRPTLEYYIEKYIVAEEQGGAYLKILYLAVKQGGPTVEYYIFL